MRYIKGDKKRSLTLKLLTVTMDALVEGGFITSNQRDRNFNSIEMKIAPVVAKYCEEFIDTHPKMTLLDLTQVLMLQSGKFLMKPVINKSNSDFQMKINSKDTQEKDWDKSIENWLIS